MSGSTSTDAPAGDQCVANIGVRQRRMRLQAGWAALGVALVSATVLMLLRVPSVWLLLLAFPLWIAGGGFFQYREKT